MTPRSARRRLKLEGDGSIKAYVNSAPVAGEANRELIGLLSAALKVPKCRIEVARGSRGRNKVVKISGLNEVELRERLAEVFG